MYGKKKMYGGKKKFQGAGNSGQPRRKIRMTQRDRDMLSGQSESMQYSGTKKGTDKKELDKKVSKLYRERKKRETEAAVENKFKSKSPASYKAGKSRQEVQSTPGGSGGGSKSAAKKSGKKTYAEAKKADPKLDSYIKKRNALRAAGKTNSAEYRAVQNKINAAYGVGTRRRETPNVEKMESKTVSSMRTAPKAKTKGATSSKSKSKGSTGSSTASKRKTGVESKDKAVARQLRDIGIEDNKEVSFDSPSPKKSTSKKEARKSRRKAIKASRKEGRKERRAIRRGK